MRVARLIGMILFLLLTTLASMGSESGNGSAEGASEPGYFIGLSRSYVHEIHEGFGYAALPYPSVIEFGPDSEVPFWTYLTGHWTDPGVTVEVRDGALVFQGKTTPGAGSAGIGNHAGVLSAFRFSSSGDFEVAAVVTFHELPGWLEVRCHRQEPDLAIVTEGCYWPGCFAYWCRYSSSVRSLGDHVKWQAHSVPLTVEYRLIYDYEQGQVCITANGRLITRERLPGVANLDEWQVRLCFISDGDNPGPVHIEVEEIHIGYDSA